MISQRPLRVLMLGVAVVLWSASANSIDTEVELRHRLVDSEVAVPATATNTHVSFEDFINLGTFGFSIYDSIRLAPSDPVDNWYKQVHEAEEEEHHRRLKGPGHSSSRNGKGKPAKCMKDGAELPKPSGGWRKAACVALGGDFIHGQKHKKPEENAHENRLQQLLDIAPFRWERSLDISRAAMEQVCGHYANAEIDTFFTWNTTRVDFPEDKDFESNNYASAVVVRKASTKALLYGQSCDVLNIEQKGLIDVLMEIPLSLDSWFGPTVMVSYRVQCKNGEEDCRVRGIACEGDEAVCNIRTDASDRRRLGNGHWDHDPEGCECEHGRHKEACNDKKTCSASASTSDTERIVRDRMCNQRVSVKMSKENCKGPEQDETICQFNGCKVEWHDCFAANTLVDIQGRGVTPMEDVVSGDYIRSLDQKTGEIFYDRVILNYHKHQDLVLPLVQICVHDDCYRLTQNHQIVANGQTVSAGSVQVGDMLHGEGTTYTVTSVGSSSGRVVMPLTYGGHLLACSDAECDKSVLMVTFDDMQWGLSPQDIVHAWANWPSMFKAVSYVFPAQSQECHLLHWIAGSPMAQMFIGMPSFLTVILVVLVDLMGGLGLMCYFALTYSPMTIFSTVAGALMWLSPTVLNNKTKTW